MVYSLHMVLGHVYRKDIYIEDIVYIWCWDMYLEEVYRGHSLHMVLGHVSRGDI